MMPFIVFVLFHDLMNYLLYICMPICCMTLINKDNNNWIIKGFLFLDCSVV